MSMMTDAFAKADEAAGGQSFVHDAVEASNHEVSPPAFLANGIPLRIGSKKQPADKKRRTTSKAKPSKRKATSAKKPAAKGARTTRQVDLSKAGQMVRKRDAAPSVASDSTTSKQERPRTRLFCERVAIEKRLVAFRFPTDAKTLNCGTLIQARLLRGKTRYLTVELQGMLAVGVGPGDEIAAELTLHERYYEDGTRKMRAELTLVQEVPTEEFVVSATRDIVGPIFRIEPTDDVGMVAIVPRNAMAMAA